MDGFYLTNKLGREGLKIGSVYAQEIIQARKYIVAVREVEDAFGLMGRAYVEFEECTHSLTVNYYFDERKLDIYRFFDHCRAKLNLRVVNFLSSARSYDDYLRSRSDILDEESPAESKTKIILSRYYDESFEFRVVSSLRNHAIHHQLPVGTISFPLEIKFENEENFKSSKSRTRAKLVVLIDHNSMVENVKLNRKIRTELSKITQSSINLRFLLSGFVSAVAGVQKELRNIWLPCVDSRLETLKRAQEEYFSFAGGGNYNLYLVEIVDGVEVMSITINHDRLSIVKDAMRRWSGLETARRVYFSSEINRIKDVFPLEDPKLWVAP